MANNQFIKNCLQVCADWGLIPTSFRQCMAWEEQVLWLSKFLQEQVIPVVNGHTEAIKVIEHWLDNLDVQDEINNKLDEMAESGELADIIAQYLQLAGVLAYNTAADLAAAENLANGSICRTLGQNTYNDGNGAFFKVRTLTTSDVVDGRNIIALTNSDTLVAERISELSDHKLEAYYLYSSTDDFGDSTVYLGDKNIIVDFGNDNHTTNDFLDEKGVKKIDAIIITHYHNDHVGTITGAGLQAVLENPNIDFSDCVAYLPHKGNDYSQWTDPDLYQATETAIKGILTTAGITWIEPDNEQEVFLDANHDIALQFFNIGADFYQYYYDVIYDGKTNPNNFSMMTLITAYGKTIFNGGDMESKSCELNAKYLKNVDVYHSLHHGSVLGTPINWNVNLAPRYCVIARRNVAGIDGNRYCGSDVTASLSKGAILLDVKKLQETAKITINTLGVISSVASNSPYTANITANPTNVISPMDLNNLTACGTYYVQTGASFKNFTNIPPALFSTDDKYTGGRIDVLSKTNAAGAEGVYQIITYQNLSNNLDLIFYRSYGNGSWNAWKFLKPGVVNDSDFSIRYMMGVAYVTGGGKDLKLWIPYTDYISDESEVITLNSFTALNVRIPTGGYLVQNVASSSATYTYSIDRGSQCGFTLVVKKADDTAWSVPNNSICVHEIWNASFHIGAR